jgi:hypothetical protein
MILTIQSASTEYNCGLKFCKSFTLIYWETVVKYVHQVNLHVNLIS